MNAFEGMAMNNSQAQQGPMSIESILGISADTANLLEGYKTWAKGNYMFQVTDAKFEEYDIKTEGHPFIGRKAVRLAISLTCLNCLASTMKDAEGRQLTDEQAKEYIGTVFKESVLFGNDGLVSKDVGNNKKAYFAPQAGETPSFSGFNKLHTLMQRFVGAEAYEVLKKSAENNTGKMVAAMLNRKFGCAISHNINPNNPNAKVQHQLDIMGEFLPVVA
jgi:hypothetical protein